MGFRWILPETCVNADLYNYPKLHSKQTVSPSVILHLNKKIPLKQIIPAVSSIHLSPIFCQALLPKRNHEVHNRASGKGSGSYTGQNSRQWPSFLQWYYVKTHKKLRYKLVWSKHEIYIAFIWSMIFSSIAWFFFYLLFP